MTEGLTGDPFTDRLVGPALRLAGGVRTYDRAEVLAAFEDAQRLLPSPLAAARALAAVCAALVPWDADPNKALAWLRREEEFHRLRGVGLSAIEAADVISGPGRHAVGINGHRKE